MCQSRHSLIGCPERIECLDRQDRKRDALFNLLRALFRRTAARTGGGVDVRPGPIWVANHFRAITDLVAFDQTRPQWPPMAGVTEINRWLDTRSGIAVLRAAFPEPLVSLWEGATRRHDTTWLATLAWE